MKIILGCSLLIAATAAVAQPNLTPYQPSGWSGKIVVGPTGSTTNFSGTLYTTNSAFVAWSIINKGTAVVTNSFYVYLYLDGTFNNRWSISSLPVNYYEYITNYNLGALAAGSHSVFIVADATMAVANDNRSDDATTNTFSITGVTLPAPVPLTPVNGSTGQPEVPYFSWTPVAQATSYRVLVAGVGSDLPSSPTATSGTGMSIALNAVTPTTNFSPTTQLNPNATYYWEVHGLVGANEDAVWSGIQQFTTGPLGSGITIIPTFDSTITSDPQAATIEATINAAISVYRQNFSDQITANFTFAEMTNGLGFNIADERFEQYSNYRAALVSHATTADDATALAHLPSGSANPVNGNAQVALKNPLARALGFSASSMGQDATVYLNTSIMNLGTLATDPNKYSLFSTVSHEMDEALGFGSILNGQTNGVPPAGGPVLPEDLFRYDQSGNRSLTTSLTADAYFSLDGTTDLAQFNQFDGGDFGDWYSYDATVVPQVQDAFLSPGVNPVLGVELRGLDAIGFTRITPPTNVVVAQLTGAGFVGSSFQVTLNGLVGSNYVIQTSSNLLTWTPLSTNTVPSGGAVTITNFLPGPQARRFFRAMLN